MICHGQKPTEPSAPASQATTPDGPKVGGKAKFFSALAVTGAVVVGPHAICILGALGLGGAASWFGLKLCSSATCPPDSVGTDPGDKIPLQRLATVPTEYSELPKDTEERVVAALLDKVPVFHDVLLYKQRQPGGEGEVQFVAVIDKDGNLIAGLCREGMMCPCSHPEFFVVGNVNSFDAKGETFSGQKEILTLVKPQAK